MLPAVAEPLHWWSARDLAHAIASRELSAVEVMRAHLDRIHEVNPRLNAIVTLLDDDAALAMAQEADRAVAAGGPLGPLHGLPFAVKDLMDTAGMRTTYGSPLYADHVPTTDSLLARRVREAGALVIGKTNTPEWGAGSQTFNPVFGATRNPYDPTLHLRRLERRRAPSCSPRGCCPSPTAPTSAAACATRPRSATSSACARPRAACRRARRATRSTRTRSWARWPAARPTRGCCSPSSRVTTASRRWRSTTIRAPSRRFPPAGSRACGSPGARRPPACRTSRRS